MRFIIDAHLPKSVVKAFANLGHTVIHTSELPNGNATSDNDILILAAEDGIVVSKDEDFISLSFFMQNLHNLSLSKLEIGGLKKSRPSSKKLLLN